MIYSQPEISAFIIKSHINCSQKVMAPKSTVFITGCSDGGIGSALAHSFYSLGFHVFASARDVSKMASLKNFPTVTLVSLDVTSPSDIKAAVEFATKETGGTLDFLISNAGLGHFSPILDEDIEKAKEIFEVNVWGPMALTKAFAPLVMRAKGSIVYVTSIGGYSNTPWMGRLQLNHTLRRKAK
jgi:1-acylglycerone phosphate reductase